VRRDVRVKRGAYAAWRWEAEDGGRWARARSGSGERTTTRSPGRAIERTPAMASASLFSRTMWLEGTPTARAPAVRRPAAMPRAWVPGASSSVRINRLKRPPARAPSSRISASERRAQAQRTPSARPAAGRMTIRAGARAASAAGPSRRSTITRASPLSALGPGGVRVESANKSLQYCQTPRGNEAKLWRFPVRHRWVRFCVRSVSMVHSARAKRPTLA